MKKIIIIFTLLIAFNINAQKVPTSGKKTIPVKESRIGEYLQILKKNIPQAIVENCKKTVTRKLKKYGFTDITITGVGQVLVPEEWPTRLDKLAENNRALGEAQLSVANTTAEITAAVNKMYQADDNDEVDKNFQVNFVNNKTGKSFKLRVSFFKSPKYIIKESDLIDNIREN
jgi:hypothetical protein